MFCPIICVCFVCVQWEELYGGKPDDKKEDPEEARLLEKAKENLGDYKLKTASDYVVPEDQRVTTKSKRKQLVMLRAHVRRTLHSVLCRSTIMCTIG